MDISNPLPALHALLQVPEQGKQSILVETMISEQIQSIPDLLQRYTAEEMNESQYTDTTLKLVDILCTDVVLLNYKYPKGGKNTDEARTEHDSRMRDLQRLSDYYRKMQRESKMDTLIQNAFLTAYSPAAVDVAFNRLLNEWKQYEVDDSGTPLDCMNPRHCEYLINKVSESLKVINPQITKPEVESSIYFIAQIKSGRFRSHKENILLYFYSPDKGTGKSTAADVICNILRGVTSAKDACNLDEVHTELSTEFQYGRFDKPKTIRFPCVHFDEPVGKGKKEIDNKFKSFVTAGSVDVELKFGGVKSMQKYNNCIISSNEPVDWLLSDEDERRVRVIHFKGNDKIKALSETERYDLLFNTLLNVLRCVPASWNNTTNYERTNDINKTHGRTYYDKEALRNIFRKQLPALLIVDRVYINDVHSDKRTTAKEILDVINKHTHGDYSRKAVGDICDELLPRVVDKNGRVRYDLAKWECMQEYLNNTNQGSNFQESDLNF